MQKLMQDAKDDPDVKGAIKAMQGMIADQIMQAMEKHGKTAVKQGNITPKQQSTAPHGYEQNTASKMPDGTGSPKGPAMDISPCPYWCVLLRAAISTRFFQKQQTAGLK